LTPVNAQILVNQNSHIFLNNQTFLNGVTTVDNQIFLNKHVFVPNNDIWLNKTTATDSGYRLRLHLNSTGSHAGGYVDVEPNLHFRIDTWTILKLQQDGKIVADRSLGIGRVPDNAYRLDVAGTIRVGTNVITSDKNLKANIQPMAFEPSKLLQLNPKTYNRINKITKRPTQKEKMAVADVTADEDTTVALGENIWEDQISDRNSMGFLAQELREIYPELVYEDAEGVLAVDYISLIPVMIKFIQEEHKELQYLKAKVAHKELEKQSRLSSPTYEDEELAAMLYSNHPNPFSFETIIGYYLPEHLEGTINIYDLNGKEIKKYNLKEKGEAELIVKGNWIKPGIYIYALVINGKIIDSKRMVFTK
jgi:hypothetical protein